ncbi:MAG: LysM peptidoglycan-binding domain-containing protein, partial [Spirochaetaceae bacterium]|nr:LysM peptidoglycan-binding domain-containing protein [Spirochaetaceae bacterium]
IRNSIQDVIDYLFIVKKIMKEELDVANAQRARNKHVLDPQHLEKQLFGNEYVIWVDENGVERVFQSESSVNPYSNSNLPDGEMNIWPSGTSFTSIYGRNWTMTMDPAGIITVTEEDTEKQYSYNEYGRLVQIKDRDSNSVDVNFSGRRIISATDRFGRMAEFFTNEDGKITKITDFTGRSVSYSYSGRLLSSFTNVENYTFEYEYDNNNNLNLVRNPDGTDRRYVYRLFDDLYRVTEEYDELNYGQYFDYFDGETVHTNREEGQTRFTIENYHIEKIEYPDGRIEEDIHNNRGYRIRHIYSSKDEHNYTPDDQGNGLYERLATGAEITRTYHDMFNLPESELIETDSWKTENKIDYYNSGNGKGRVRKITYTNPDSGVLDSEIYIEYTYDLYGRLTWKRDKNGQESEFIYFDKYPLSGSTMEIVKNGVTTTLTMDELGRVISQSRGDIISEYTLDTLGRILLQTQLGENGQSISTQYRYNYHGVEYKAGPFSNEDQSTLYSEFKYNNRSNLTNILISERTFTREPENIVLSSYFDEDLVRETIISYDREENPVFQQNPDGTQSYYEYDRAGKLTKMGYYRNSEKVLLKEYIYDFAGRIKAILEGGYEQVSYEYPDSRHITESRYGGELRIYKTLDQLGRNESMRLESADGYKQIGYTYDYLGRISEVITNRDGVIGTEYYQYDLLGRLTYSKGLRGEEVVINTDDTLRKTTAKGPEGLISEVIYDIYGNLIETSESGKGTTNYFYDSFGRLTSTTLPEGEGYTYTYDTLGRPVEILDRKGEKTTIIYGPMGSYREIINPKLEKTRIEYDIAGRVIAQIDPRGAVRRSEYDPYTGAVTAQYGAESEIILYKYDDLGYLLSITEVGENDKKVKEYKRDPYGRLTDLYGEEGYHIGYEYDYNGNLRKMTQGPESYEKVLRQWEYSIDGLLEAEVYSLDGREFRKEFDYDLSGLLERETNYRNQEINYSYDGLGRIDLVNFPDGEFYDWSYNFTSSGSVFNVEAADGYSHEYGMNKEGQILYDEDLSTRDRVDYRYNRAQELEKVLGPKQAMSLTYSYDELGRISNVTSGGSEQVDFIYDASGNMVRVEYGSSEKSQSDYFYDLSGRMTGYRTVKNWGNHEELLDGYIYQYDNYGDVIYQADKDGLVTRYKYDGLDRLHQVWYPSQKGEKNQAAVKERKDLGLNGNDEKTPEYLSSLTDIGNIESAFLESYGDVFGNWNQKTDPFLNGQFHNERIEYDIYGRRSEKVNEFGSIQYGYNEMDQLLRAGNRAYEYDADGNRKREFFTDQAWLTDEAGLNLTIQENDLIVNGQGKGNGLGQLGGNNSNPHSGLQETWSYFEYRADNRMTRYYDSQGEDWTYKYDGFGRRYEKERSASAHPEKDVWRNDEIWYAGFSHNIIAEYTEIETWNDKTIQSGLEYLIGPGGRAYGAHENYSRNGHEWSPNSWKNRRYYHYDRMGSVTAISLDKPGLNGSTYQYGPFGDVLDGGEHSWGWDYNGNYHMGFDSVGYTGYRIDAESGLYHAPFREYDPLVASWTTSDPIKDGLLWYGYVNNNPVKFTDPLGLFHECSDGSSGLIQDGDTLTGISNQTGININTLLRLNPQISDPDIIFAGHTLDLRDDNHDLMYEILGNSYNGIQIDIDAIDIVISDPSRPSEVETRAAANGMNLGISPAEEQMLLLAMVGRGTSLPNDTIYMPNGVSTTKNKAVLIHEYYHQMQYALIGKESAFSRLVAEQMQYEMTGHDPKQSPYNYTINNTGVINSLSDITTLEGQAQYIEHFARGYLYQRGSSSYTQDLKDRAMVLRNSGLDSQAISEVLR